MGRKLLYSKVQWFTCKSYPKITPQKHQEYFLIKHLGMMGQTTWHIQLTITVCLLFCSFVFACHFFAPLGQRFFGSLFHGAHISRTYGDLESPKTMLQLSQLLAEQLSFLAQNLQFCLCEWRYLSHRFITTVSGRNIHWEALYTQVHLETIVLNCVYVSESLPFESMNEKIENTSREAHYSYKYLVHWNKDQINKSILSMSG